MKNYYFKKKIKNIFKKGFTLIEMLIVIAILGFVTSVVLFNNNNLNSVVLISNRAYEIGLIVREAQVAGLGVKATDNGTNSEFSASYGVFIDKNNPTKIIFFADKDNNGIYDSAASPSEFIEQYEIKDKRSGQIIGICKEVDLIKTSPTPNTACISSVGISDVNITFKRPNPEAFFQYPTIDAGGNLAYEAYHGTIIVTYGDGDVCKSLSIQKTGAVELGNKYCQ